MFSLKNVEKPLVLQAKRPKNIEKPLVLQATSHQPRSTDPGSDFDLLAWMSYEEPLQPSCLGKYYFMISTYFSIKIIKEPKFQNGGFQTCGDVP